MWTNSGLLAMVMAPSKTSFSFVASGRPRNMCSRALLMVRLKIDGGVVVSWDGFGCGLITVALEGESLLVSI
jgi:hypothetical protein